MNGKSTSKATKKTTRFKKIGKVQYQEIITLKDIHQHSTILRHTNPIPSDFLVYSNLYLRKKNDNF